MVVTIDGSPTLRYLDGRGPTHSDMSALRFNAARLTLICLNPTTWARIAFHRGVQLRILAWTARRALGATLRIRGLACRAVCALRRVLLLTYLAAVALVASQKTRLVAKLPGQTRQARRLPSFGLVVSKRAVIAFLCARVDAIHAMPTCFAISAR